MNPRRKLSGQSCEDDIRYRVAACRKRLRSMRATHRVEDQNQSDVLTERTESEVPVVESYAELLATVSMNQSSLSKLVECLLGPIDSDSDKPLSDTVAEREEATIT